MVRIFINRPVFSTIISVVIIVLGLISLMTLPVTQYPEIAPPTVNVSANYPGSNAETLLNSVIIPLEEQINGVEGMTYLTSTSTNNGRAEIEIYFHQEVDADIAAVNVQNRVARALPLLPVEVVRSGVVTQKRQNSTLMVITFFSTNPAYNDVFIQNYLNINVTPELQRIPGVGDASAVGSKNYAMRIWLDPTKLAAYSLVPQDVTDALNRQSLEAAGGQLGENAGQSFQYVLKYAGKYKTAEQYEQIIIKALPNGRVLHLKDIAKIEMGALGYSTIARNNGLPSAVVRIYQTSGKGSNAYSIINEIKNDLEQRTLPEGISYVINYDTNSFLEASLTKVTYTLIEATLLVLVVVYIFLQEIRLTIIPAIVIPVSIIGTFFFLQVFDFSINLLTLFALILAIGIVVDDAIVVVEAVHAKIESTGKPAKEATIEAMQEITMAIISISLIMGAVFIPVTFLSGPTGIFYQQFGITLMAAIGISAISALTLTPALCALLLKGKKNKQSAKNYFFKAINHGLGWMMNTYINKLYFLVKNAWLVVFILIGTVSGIFFINQTIPKGFVPNEDRGIVFSNIQLPPGATLDRGNDVTQLMQEKIDSIPGTSNYTAINGVGILSGFGSNFSSGYIRLEPWDKRGKHKEQSLTAIIAQLNQAAATIPDAHMIFFGAPSIPGFGSTSGFEMVVLDKLGQSITDLDQITKQFVSALTDRPEIAYAQTPFNTNYAQYEIVVDVVRAEESGISIRSIFSAIQGYIGGVYANDFTDYGKHFRVMVQALPEDRINEQSLEKIFVRTNTGQMAPINRFVSLKRIYGPQAITRFNLYNSARINGASTPGYSSGDAIRAIQEVAQSHLPPGYGIDYTGMTREEVKASSELIIIFILSLLFVYFVLCVQYESFFLPFAVIFSLPLGILGAFLAQSLAGLENNIYFQIALIMLLGLLAKNAILIIEFAIQRRNNGESIQQAAINAARARLRPILMTSFAFVLGVTPLIVSTGAGAVGNRSISTGVAFGLLLGTVVGVVVIPILFIFFQKIQEYFKPIMLDNR